MTRDEINRAFGYEIIATPSTQNPPTNAGGNNTPNDGGGNPTAPSIFPSTNNGGNDATNNGGGESTNPPNQNNNPNNSGFVFDMDGEDEVRP